MQAAVTSWIWYGVTVVTGTTAEANVCEGVILKSLIDLIDLIEIVNMGINLNLNTSRPILNCTQGFIDISRVKPVVSHQVAPIHLHDVSHMWQSTIE